MNTLAKEEREKVKELESRAVFRFGDGVETKSMKRVTVLVYIVRQNFIIDVEVVENKIPLLIRTGAMRQMGMKVDFEKDVAIIRGEKLKLLCISSGRYCLPFNFFWLGDNSIDFILHLNYLKNLSEEETMVKALKLHRQFSYASNGKLNKLLKNGGCEIQEFLKCIDMVCDDCQFCQKFRQPPLRPVVGFPLAHDFNEVVCMDLKELEHIKLLMLHLIDAATRFSETCLK